MGTEKRARQKANRAERRAEEEAEAAKEHREESTKKYGKWIAIAAAIFVLLVGISFFRGGDDDNASDSGEGRFAPTPAPSVEPTEVPVIVLSDEIPADFEPFVGNGALSLVQPEARNNAYSAPPPDSLDPSQIYGATIFTSAGRISMNLFSDEAPVAVNNFISLARDGFYDGLTFHLVNDTQAVAGDPTGTGSGGAGYTFEDEISSERLFDQAGVLAMQNNGPDSNSSQFFLTRGPASALDGNHTIFGSVPNPDLLEDFPTSGEPVVIESISIIESNAG